MTCNCWCSWRQTDKQCVATSAGRPIAEGRASASRQLQVYRLDQDECERRGPERPQRGTAKEHEKGSPNNGTGNSEVANWGAEETQEELPEYPARRRYSLNSRGHGHVFEKLVVTQLVQKFHRLTQTEGYGIFSRHPISSVPRTWTAWRPCLTTRVTLAPRNTNTRPAYVRHSPGVSTQMFPTAFHILSLKFPAAGRGGK